LEVSSFFGGKVHDAAELRQVEYCAVDWLLSGPPLGDKIGAIEHNDSTALTDSTWESDRPDSVLSQLSLVNATNKLPGPVGGVNQNFGGW
jgi:hypothetical protein